MASSGRLSRKSKFAHRLAGTPLLSIAAAAFAMEVPFFFCGTPSGHDFEFHLYSWLEVLSRWKAGVLYPRWAALAQFGYGEPRFIFYPPASWTLGAALSAIFPWTIVPDIYIWLALVAAGTSMFLLARPWLNRRDATFAAVLYAVNPYHLVIVYWRSAFAELLAASLLPLLLLLVLRAGEAKEQEANEKDAKEKAAEKNGLRVNIFLAFLLAAAWLTNAPAAVMIHYSLALLALVLAWQARSPRILFRVAGSVLLGTALAAFYLLPAIYEQRWVNIAEAVSAGLRPQDSFLFARTADPDHDAFNRVVSWVALAEIAMTLAAVWAARTWGRRNRMFWYLLLTWAAASSLLMLSFTHPLWSILPKLRFMQFPWRWMLCLGVPFALMITVSVRRWLLRAAVYAALVGVVILAGRHYQPPWWDNAADLRELKDNVATGAGYEGTDEYSPLGSDALALDKTARRVTVAGPARAAIRVFEWKPERTLFTAEMLAPDDLVLRLLNYPAWRVEVNGKLVRTGTRENTGQMLVPVEAGSNRVEISFVRTWDRKAGAWISAVTIFLLLLFAWRLGVAKID